MGWYNPSSVAETSQSIARGHSFRNARLGIAGDSVAVLSYCGMTGLLPDLDHALSQHVLTGAEWYRDSYMNTGSRKPHPSTVMYYVRDLKFSRRVVLAIQADGTILDELDSARPDMRPATRDAIRAAIAELDPVRFWNPWGDYSEDSV